VYYSSFVTANPKFLRIRLGENHPEELFGLSDLPRLMSVMGPWNGIAPDGSALFVRDISTHEIYALDVDLP
jgi:hypothetical protein